MAKKNEFSKGRAGKKHDRSMRFASRTPLLAYYLIVTDTKKTEKNYFDGLKDSIPAEIRDRIVIHVEKAKTTYSLIEKTQELLSSSVQQRIPWIVFDRDEVKNFDEIIERAICNEINVGWSNPCFEIWMFAYFGTMPNIIDSISCCRRFEERFEKVTGQKYQKSDKDIFRKLDQHGSFKKAYLLAEKTLTKAKDLHEKPSESIPACTVHHLVKEIKDRAAGNENQVKE